jgi:hypothetical protein
MPEAIQLFISAIYITPSIFISLLFIVNLDLKPTSMLKRAEQRSHPWQ